MKVVLQDGIKDCGICCLLSIIRHYGGNASKEYLRDLTNTTKNGVSAYNLISGAKQLGFKAEALKGEIEQINANNLPCIAHVIINKSYKHFVVIDKIDLIKEKVLIMDPAVGKKCLSFSEFKLQTSFHFIFLTPHKKLPIYQEKTVIKQMMIRFCKKNKSYLILIMILTINQFLFTLLSTFHFKYILEFAINYHIDQNILLISMIVFVFLIFKDLSSYLRDILLMKYSNIFDEIMTKRIYKQIILLPYLYYKNRTSGEVISRIRDLALIKNFYLKLITSLSIDILSMTIFIILLLNINKKLTLLSLLFFILMVIINFSFKNKVKEKLGNYYRCEEKVNSYLIETLSSVDAIKGMHIEKKTSDKFNLKYRNYLSNLYSLSSITNTNSLVKNIIDNLFHVLLLCLGGKYVVNKIMTLSELIIYQSILSFLIPSFKNILNLINEYPKYKLSKQRIEDLFTIKEENFEAGHYFDEIHLNGDIVYHDLTYSYHSKKLLDHITFTIKHKDKLFLYGPSGTGKSTFVKLLMRYIEVPFGNISINNIDINHYHLDVLRNKITYVSQQEFLFNDTLYNNISLSRKIDRKKVEEVIKMTYANEIASMDSLVEENGFNFSGGERQRIILARSLLKESDIYIFDEALSQIDIEKERKILIRMFQYLKDKTVIVISHRFNNQDLFNRMIKISNGCIDEKKL